jgi:hypothetical protein
MASALDASCNVNGRLVAPSNTCQWPLEVHLHLDGLAGKEGASSIIFQFRAVVPDLAPNEIMTQKPAMGKSRPEEAIGSSVHCAHDIRYRKLTRGMNRESCLPLTTMNTCC